MVDLTKRPFYLNEEQIKWVEDTYASMSYDEKVGQLFINLTLRRDPAYITELCDKYHIGGVRWQGGKLEEVYEQNRLFQEKSRIPVLIAANCEAGGNGAVGEGTMVATGAACAASTTVDTMRDMARVGGEEASAIGCNWTFAPVCDVVSNWRNTIVNTRAYGNDPDQIIELSKAYMEEMKKLPYVHILGKEAPEDHHGIVTFTIDGVHPHDIAAIFDEHDVNIRAGHHCAQPLMKFCHTPSTVRASIGLYNTSDDVYKFIAALKKIRGEMGYQD